jgi:hypothetical protein
MDQATDSFQAVRQMFLHSLQQKCTVASGTHSRVRCRRARGALLPEPMRGPAAQNGACPPVALKNVLSACGTRMKPVHCSRNVRMTHGKGVHEVPKITRHVPLRQPDPKPALCVIIWKRLEQSCKAHLCCAFRRCASTSLLHPSLQRLLLTRSYAQ